MRYLGSLRGRSGTALVLVLSLLFVSALATASMARSGFVEGRDGSVPAGQDVQDLEIRLFLPALSKSAGWIGTWEGGASGAGGGQAAQVSLDFGESVPLDGNSYKASGAFVWSEPVGASAAEQSRLPMLAKVTDLGDGTYDLIVSANVVAHGEVTTMRLVGTLDLGESGLADDTIAGQWYRREPDGTLVEGDWSTAHLDEIVDPLEFELAPPLYLHCDLSVFLHGDGGSTPLTERDPKLGIDVHSNVVMDSAAALFPDGTSVTLQPFVDVFTPGVDWVSEFRFGHFGFGLPVQGQPYVVVALDATGAPIAGITAADLWAGGTPPNPPINVRGTVTDDGIVVRWAPVDDVPGSFEPGRGIGWFQMEIYDGAGQMVYGAHFVQILEHLVPRDRADLEPGQDWGTPLGELADGEYTLLVHAMAVAPEGLGGHGIEYNATHQESQIGFAISGGVINIH